FFFKQKTAYEIEQPGASALYGLDNGREDVRQLGGARPAGGVRTRRGHRGMDRRPPADVRRGEDPLLDSREACLWREAGAIRAAGIRCGAAQDPIGRVGLVGDSPDRPDPLDASMIRRTAF